MKEMYNNYEEEDDDWDLPEEKDPFQEDLNQEICIGTAQVFLQPIGTWIVTSNALRYNDTIWRENPNLFIRAKENIFRK